MARDAEIWSTNNDEVLDDGLTSGTPAMVVAGHTAAACASGVGSRSAVLVDHHAERDPASSSPLTAMSAATRRDRARRSVRTSSSPIAGAAELAAGNLGLSASLAAPATAGVDWVADHELELGRGYSPAVRAATQGRGRAGDLRPPRRQPPRRAPRQGPRAVGGEGRARIACRLDRRALRSACRRRQWIGHALPRLSSQSIRSCERG